MDGDVDGGWRAGGRGSSGTLVEGVQDQGILKQGTIEVPPVLVSEGSLSGRVLGTHERSRP